jgi:hypothetical protein
MSTRLDHLVITTPRLAHGVAAVEAALGVPMRPGGQHGRMGTHNAVLRLGEAAYLEVIAVDPSAPPPSRPRWFGLSRPPVDTRLAHWVLACDDIDVWAPNLGFDDDAVIDMARGDYRWRITVPADGHLPEAGLLPSLIQWEAGGHPSERLPEAGCRLLALVLRHPEPARLAARLESVDFEDARLRIQHSEEPGLQALIGTPGGERWLFGDD